MSRRVMVYGRSKLGVRRWLASRLAERARRRRHETYRGLIGPRTDETIIDIGCGAAGLAEFGPRSQITGSIWPTGPPTATRLQPISDLLLKMLIAKIPDETLSIINVGAGPLTAVGKTYLGKTVNVTVTDPLAPEYAPIMQEAGIDPPVPPVACRGEDLLNLFRPGTFDLAFAGNDLDHCVDPVRVIRNVVQLVKPERFVVLRHLQREARTHLYWACISGTSISRMADSSSGELAGTRSLWIEC